MIIETGDTGFTGPQDTPTRSGDTPRRRARRSIVRQAFAVALLVASVVLAGCSSTQTVAVAADGSAEAEVVVEVHPIFSAYLSDLAWILGTPTDETFRPDLIRHEFLRREPLDLEAIVIEPTEEGDPEVLRMALIVRAMDGVLGDEPEAPEVSFDVTAGGGVVSITIEPEDTRSLLALSPVIDPRALDYLLPPPEAEMTKEEYEEYLAWSFEEYADGYDLPAVISGARLVLSLNLPGRAIAASGHESRFGRRVTFSIGVTELLTMRETRTYVAEYADR